MNINLTKTETELTDALKVAAGGAYVFQSVYSVPITAKRGDVILVSVNAEVTNPNADRLGVGRYLMLADAPDKAVGGHFISAPRVGYVENYGNHTCIDTTASHIFSQDFSGHLNFVMYAYSVNPATDIHVNGLKRDGQPYGGLCVLQFAGDGEFRTGQTTAMHVVKQDASSIKPYIYGAYALAAIATVLAAYVFVGG